MKPPLQPPSHNNNSSSIMPRASKTGTRKHAAAVPLRPAQSAEKVLPGSDLDATIADMARKEVDTQRAQLRHKPFHAALVANSQPYSKSHLKREKKKARQQLASGMGSVAAALVEVAPELVPEIEAVEAGGSREEVAAVEAARRRRSEDDGKIGLGTKRTMREKQRRKQISAAAVRIPAVMQHPSFRANPWATIREHASNTLATADAVRDLEAKARARRTPKANITVGGMEGVE